MTNDTIERTADPGQLVPGMGGVKNGVCHHLGWRHPDTEPCCDHAPSVRQLLRKKPIRWSQR